MAVERRALPPSAGGVGARGPAGAGPPLVFSGRDGAPAWHGAVRGDVGAHDPPAADVSRPERATRLGRARRRARRTRPADRRGRFQPDALFVSLRAVRAGARARARDVGAVDLSDLFAARALRAMAVPAHRPRVPWVGVHAPLGRARPESRIGSVSGHRALSRTVPRPGYGEGDGRSRAGAFVVEARGHGVPRDLRGPQTE